MFLVLFNCTGQECSGPRSKHLVVVTLTLGLKVGHGLSPLLKVRSVKEHKLLSLVIWYYKAYLVKYIYEYKAVSWIYINEYKAVSWIYINEYKVSWIYINDLSLVDLGWLGWRVPLLFCLLWLHLNVAPLGQMGLYLLIRLWWSRQWEHTKLSNQFQFVLERSARDLGPSI